MTPHDIRQAWRAKRAGARYPHKIVKWARKHDIPLSWAFALVQQESGFRNVFGHDHGSILFGQSVTRVRVHVLLTHIARGGTPNGVGLTQLTWPPFVRRAEARGGAHRPDVQLDVGFEIFAGHIDHGRRTHDAWHYNGDPDYQPQIEAKQRFWHEVLTR